MRCWILSVTLLATQFVDSDSVTAFQAPATESDESLSATVRIPWTTGRIIGSPDPPSPYRVERLFPGLEFDQPVEMVSYPVGNRFCVVERKGSIFLCSYDSQTTDRELFFDGAVEIDGLTAVYGLAFHPDFEMNRTVFVCYILAAGQPDGTRVSRFQVTRSDRPRIDPATETILLTWRSGGHNGGSLKFGPDGFLYISTGDGSPPAPPDEHDTGQDVSDLLGSILRIDVDRPDGGQHYAIPNDNPFVDIDGAAPEVWAYGLRNPWRMSFDRVSGDLWLGDVGWQLWEMVHRIERGGNYGWSIMEGPQSARPTLKPGPTPIRTPVAAHPRSEAASVTGGFVYRGSRLRELVGHYVYGDYVTGKIWSLKYDDGDVTGPHELVDTPTMIIAFHEDPTGELSFMDYTAGTIHRLVPNEAVDTSSDFPRRLSRTGLFESVKTHTPAPGVFPFSVNVEQWADGAAAERFVAVPGYGTMTLAKPVGRVPLDWGRFPKDTVLVKTISVDALIDGRPGQRRMETQVLHHTGETWRGNSGEWRGYSYVWNDEQTDAVLADPWGMDVEYSVVGGPDGDSASASRVWHVPSRTECYACHNPWTGYRLAFTVPQLNRTLSGAESDQIARLESLGIVSLDAPETKQSQPYARDGQLPTHVNPYDHITRNTSRGFTVGTKDAPVDFATLDNQARSYLDVNCSHCHRFGGGGTATIDLRYSVALEDTGLLDAKPTQGTFGIRDTRIVAPGDPYRSVLLLRIAKLGRGRMPHIGSHNVDAAGVALIARWIADMPTNVGVPAQPMTAGWVAMLKAGSADDVRKIVQRTLTSSQAALQLMHVANRGDLGDRLPVIAAAAADHPDSVVRDLFERFLPPDRRRQRLGTRVRPDEILAMAGNADAGRRMFFESKGLQCRNCHRIGNVGGKLGPELNQIGRIRTPAQLLDSILDPSRTIDPKYTTWVVETADGEVVAGLLAERSESRLVIQTAPDKQVSVTLDDIEFQAPQQKSIMPDLLFRDMTAEQLADLVAFLKSLK